MSLKSADPIMNRTQAISIERIHTLLTLLAHRNQAHLLQYAQMLRDSRLRQPERHHDCSHRKAAPPRQEINDLPPPRLRNGVEDIRGRRCTCHTAIIFPYQNMSTAKNRPPSSLATRRFIARDSRHVVARQSTEKRSAWKGKRTRAVLARCL